MYKMRPRRLWRRLKKVFDYFARVKLLFWRIATCLEYVKLQVSVQLLVTMYHTQRTAHDVVFYLTYKHTVFWVESENRFVKLRLSTKGMRIIDKKGIDSVLADIRANGEKV